MGRLGYQGMFTKVLREGKRFVPWIERRGLSRVPHHDLRLLLSHKYAEGSARGVVEDFQLNHNRAIAKAYVRSCRRCT